MFNIYAYITWETIMPSPNTKRALLIAGETVSFIGFLVGFILCLIALTQLTWYNIVDFITLPEFIVMVTFLAIFLLLPVIARIAVYQINRVEFAVRKEQLTQEILNQLRGNRRADVDFLTAQFQLTEADVETTLDRLIESGDIRGTLAGGIFTLKEGFEVLDERTRRLEAMKKGFMAFIQPYRFISLQKIADNFKVPVSDIEKNAHELIASKEIRGFIDGGNLVREISSIALDFTDLPTCPYCDNRILENSLYCSTCGQPIIVEDDQGKLGDLSSDNLKDTEDTE